VEQKFKLCNLRQIEYTDRRCTLQFSATIVACKVRIGDVGENTIQHIEQQILTGNSCPLHTGGVQIHCLCKKNPPPGTGTNNTRKRESTIVQSIDC